MGKRSPLVFEVSVFLQKTETSNGTFNMAVNGNGPLTVNYQKAGYLPLQRTVKTAWQEYAVIDGIVMNELDPLVTTIDLTANTPIQVAQGSLVTDSDGSRQATVLFPQGIQASMTFPDGSTQPLTQLAVRATEYTVGENGPQAMPAPLPPASAYTYAVDLSVDQAIVAGATRVDFSQPIPLYVDNFLDFPVGGIVPIGWYDYTQSIWIPSDNGRVIEIISINNELAILDVDGSGQAASPSALAELGITEAERQQLATLYTPGKSLWRSPITHFTPWDCNWPYGPPDDAERPSGDEPKTKDEDHPDDPCEQAGCIIEAESQVLGESLGVTGTPFTLNYRSNRVPGYKAPYALEIPLRGDSVPSSLKQIVLEITIAGRRFKDRFSSSTKSTTFVWDGLDAFDRRVQGRQEAKVRIGYVYAVVYTTPSKVRQSFARIGRGPISAGRRQADITLWKEYSKSLGAKKSLGAWYPVGVGLGHFSLNIHHVYNPMTQILYQGNGKQRRASTTTNAVINTVAGNGIWDFSGDSGLATEASLHYPNRIAFGPDGRLYIADSDNDRIRRVDGDGIINTVAGNGNWGFSGDGDLATEASLSSPIGIAFGPDGSLYIADSWNHRIRRVDVDGIINTVAGYGEWGFNAGGFSGDGGLATEANLYYPNDIAFGPDGGLYMTDAYNDRIRRVDVDGIINTVAGNGEWGFNGDGGLATETRLHNPNDIAFGPDGRLYITDAYNDRIRRVDVDGIINTVAGNGDLNFSGDGGLATEAGLYSPNGITFGPDGSLYIADSDNRIRRVDVDGIINTVVGKEYTGSSFSVDGGLATETRLSLPRGITFGPDGHLYLADSWNNRIRQVGPALPKFSLGNLFIPSENGALLYEFAYDGRHLSTADSVTGSLLYRFTYNENGYLVEIKDLDGDITRIERSGDTPVAIVAQDGQRTALTLDENDYLNSITNPASETDQLNYTEYGLLTEFINPRGHKSIYRYNELGLLVEDTDAAGGGWTLARTEHPDESYTTTMTSKEGRVTHYQVKPQTNGELLRVNTSPDGTVTQTLIKTNGETVMTSADGTEILSKQGPDPRFGMQAPITEKMTITTPNGLSALVTTEKTAELTDANPLSVEKLTTKVTSNGRTSTGVYDVASKTATATSAEGRESKSFFDDKGRIIKEEVPGLANVYYSYDSRGRLTQIAEGEGDEARTALISYDDKGYLNHLTDALGRVATFSYDAVGRVTTQTLPDGRQIHYNYDQNGNVTAITPPSRPVHGFDYTEVDLQKQYTPPILNDVPQPQTQYEYNLDKQLIQIRRPDGQVIDLIYDSVKKRLNRMDLPNDKSLNYAYNALTGKLEMITAPDGSILSYTYDGSLVLSETWGNGPITGTLTRSYNNDFRVTTLGVKGNSVNYQYDNDGLLTQVGHFLLHREVQNGFLTGTTLGNVITQQTLNPFGELESRTATYQGNTLYQVAYQRDKLGRIIQKVETIEGETTTYNYHYNLVGQLVEVFQNGVSINRYDYDDNGNRLTLNSVVVGSYDAQDRLRQYGENQYAYTENGELKTKFNTITHETTSYTYDVFTNLTRVQLPDGTEIEYLIDGRDRRIGKQVNGLLVQGFLYQGSLNPVAELDVNGNIVTRFVYGGRGNIPAYLIKNEQTFRVIADSLGSPRLVVNIATGEIVQRMDYNEFGKVIEDTNPGFQPFGFAGGIYDSDTGLVRFGARDYDPKRGRWTAKDPIDFDGGDANLYGYIWNDPINSTDPSGLAVCGGGCIGAIGYGTYRAYKAYRAARAAAKAAQAMQNAIGDDDAPQDDDSAEKKDEKEGAECPKKFSKEKQALVDMAKGDKKRGITKDDMKAYKDLNKGLNDSFQEEQVRGPEKHNRGGQHSRNPHGHVGPVNHIPIR